jgi:hypothetical protein
MTDPALPADIVFDPANPPDELLSLPPGYTWELKITAEAEVVHPDGTKN